MCIRFDTISACDGQTDGRNCHNNIALCMYSTLTCYYQIFMKTSPDKYLKFGQ